MNNRRDYRFTVTIHTNDLAVLYCLRALADLCQKTGNTRITWGGTSKTAWKKSGNNATFRFTKAEYRERLISEAQRLLGKESWEIV